MTYDLNSYSAVGTALLVTLEIDEYRINPGDTPSSVTLRFCDQPSNITIGSYTFTGVGQLLGITATRSELRSSTGEITLTLSGIPNDRLKEIINSRLKGNRIQVHRIFYNSQTGGSLAIGLESTTMIGRFFGVVTNYSIEEDFDSANRTASNTLSIICSSWIEVLGSTVKNRKTNPASMKAYSPADVSFDRIPKLVGANFDFGAPQ